MTMSAERAELKAQLILKRMSVLDGKMMCEMCGHDPATDLHERWVSRKEAQGNDALMKAVLEAECNLALVCNTCNVYFADTLRGRQRIGMKLVDRYGEMAIRAWIKSLPFRTRSNWQEANQKFTIALVEIQELRDLERKLRGE